VAEKLTKLRKAKKVYSMIRHN